MSELCKGLCQCGQIVFGLWRDDRSGRRTLYCPSCKKFRQFVLVPVRGTEPITFRQRGRIAERHVRR